jgi:hypothetical protein
LVIAVWKLGSMMDQQGKLDGSTQLDPSGQSGERSGPPWPLDRDRFGDKMLGV